MTTPAHEELQRIAEAAQEAVLPIAKKAADDVYERLMRSVEDYLADNVEFNIRSRLDAAERERRGQWERAQALLARIEELEGALKQVWIAGSDLLIGFSVHNAMDAAAPDRAADIEGPVVDAFSNALHAARSILHGDQSS